MSKSKPIKVAGIQLHEQDVSDCISPVSRYYAEVNKVKIHIDKWSEDSGWWEGSVSTSWGSILTDVDGRGARDVARRLTYAIRKLKKELDVFC